MAFCKICQVRDTKVKDEEGRSPPLIDSSAEEISEVVRHLTVDKATARIMLTGYVTVQV